MIAQTVETAPKRRYRIRFSDGKFEVVTADTIYKPNLEIGSTNHRFYVFKKAGVVVAEYSMGDVSGWKVIDEKE